LKPEFPEAHYNLGNTRVAQDDLDAAVVCFERTLELSPGYAQAHYNLGCVLQSLGRLDEAFAHYEKALQWQPDFPQARFGHALAQIFNGQYDPGWRNYESRWQSIDHDTPLRNYPQPWWKGETLPSGRLLLWGEQGVGDEIMFAGLIPDALRTGNKLLLDCDRRLQPLFARSFPEVEVIADLDSLAPAVKEEIAAHLPTGSLPGLFRAEEPAFAATTSPYLKPAPASQAMFRTRYADGRRVIGLAWYTSNQKTGRKRSIDLARFAPLFRIPGIRWVSLQYGDFDRLQEQVSTARAPLFIDRSVNQLADLDLFAAQVAAMDLVITIDNSTAHLSGALGIPTWLLLPFVPDWRWLQKGGSSSWYPNLRLFRQPALNDWQPVLQTVETGLQALVKNNPQR
jgi:tetratricopeptide (TPR) repeat protein